MSQVYLELDNKGHHFTYNWSIIYATDLSRMGQKGTSYHVYLEYHLCHRSIISCKTRNIVSRIAGVSFTSMAQVYRVFDNKEHHATYSWSIIYVTGLSRVR